MRRITAAQGHSARGLLALPMYAGGGTRESVFNLNENGYGYGLGYSVCHRALDGNGYGLGYSRFLRFCGFAAHKRSRICPEILHRLTPNLRYYQKLGVNDCSSIRACQWLRL